MCSLINKQLLLTAYAYLFITGQQKAQQGSEALQLQVGSNKSRGSPPVTEFPPLSEEFPALCAGQTITLIQQGPQRVEYKGATKFPGGGQGSVYRLDGKSDVILKIPHRRHAVNFGTEVFNHEMAFQEVPENVVPIIASGKSTIIDGVVSDLPHLATQWMDQGDMAQWSKKWLGTTPLLSGEDRLRVATDFRRQIGETLKTLFTKKDLVHRDVKPGNIFVRKTEAGLKFVLGDFGSSVVGSIPLGKMCKGRAPTLMFTTKAAIDGSGSPQDHYNGDQQIVDALAVSLAKGFRVDGVFSAVPMVVSMFLEIPEADRQQFATTMATNKSFEESLTRVKNGQGDPAVAADLQATLKELQRRGALEGAANPFGKWIAQNQQLQQTSNNFAQQQQQQPGQPAQQHKEELAAIKLQAFARRIAAQKQLKGMKGQQQIATSSNKAQQQTNRTSHHRNPQRPAEENKSQPGQTTKRLRSRSRDQ